VGKEHKQKESEEKKEAWTETVIGQK
jgi:hypothetical protein